MSSSVMVIQQRAVGPRGARWCAGALVLSVDAHTWLPLPATLNRSESREAAAREGSMGCSPCEPCPRAFRVTHGMACATR